MTVNDRNPQLRILASRHASARPRCCCGDREVTYGGGNNDTGRTFGIAPSTISAAARGPMLHIDIPTLAEFKALASIKGETCVSLYVPTEPLRERERQNRIALKDLAAQALQQVKEAGVDKRRIAPFEAQIRHLVGADEERRRNDDKIRKLQHKKPDPLDEFWKFQGHGLAVLATPQMMRTFRMPYRPKPLAEVANRFHLTPLIRVMTSPHDVFCVSAGGEGRAARAHSS